MGAEKWQAIWNGKPVVSSKYDGDEFGRFCELKKANGFDVAVDDEKEYFKSFYLGWNQFYDKVIELIGSDIDSVFEVGCGSGVNLFMFMNRLKSIKEIGGVDYSDAMIKSAVLAVGEGDFTCCGAHEIDVKQQYDIVMAESVFQYFESEEYAADVLNKMIEKSRKLVYLGEIHDKESEEELMRLRKKTILDYDKKYDGLSKLFLSREFIERIAAAHGRKVFFSKVDNPYYLNGKYEFNCYIF